MSREIFKLPGDFQWLSPWEPIEADDIQATVDELRREMPPGHVLADCEFTAIGESYNYDDFLFATDCPSKPIAAVHLTWSKETNPNWPFTNIFGSLEDWISAMRKEHIEFKERYADDDEYD